MRVPPETHPLGRPLTWTVRSAVIGRGSWESRTRVAIDNTAHGGVLRPGSPSTSWHRAASDAAAIRRATKNAMQNMASFDASGGERVP